MSDFGRLYTSRELVELAENNLTHGDWGPWRLDPKSYVLYPVKPYRYEVDLERCLTSAQVLDWVCQIAGKKWSRDDSDTIAGLVRAIDDLLEPQATLCSCGKSRELTKAAVRKMVDRQVPLVRNAGLLG